MCMLIRAGWRDVERDRAIIVTPCECNNIRRRKILDTIEVPMMLFLVENMYEY